VIVPTKLEPPKLLVLENALYTKKKTYRKIECPTCKSTGCFEHCNHCGIKIRWKNEQGDAVYETNKYGKKVRVTFEEDYSIHRCMQQGTKDGKFYAVNQEPVNKLKYDYHQQNYTCMECTRPFNKLVYPLCPSCWKMECRSCHNKQSWIYKEGIEQNKCFNCGNNRLDPVHVWNSYQRCWGKYQY